MNPYQQYSTPCKQCANNTSKKYARAHDGKCKTCVTGKEQPYRGPKCPQCGGPNSRYNQQHRYVCESCYRQNDPIGHFREVMGYND